jgi:hypothetical protein
MKITRRQLRRIIQENCGDMHSAPEAMAEPVAIAVEPASAISENITPEQEMMVEMAAAQKALEVVVESAQAAAQLCVGCLPEVAVQAPIMDAVVTQAQALQEMIDAQAEVVAESTAPVDDVLSAVVDVIQ